MPAWRKACWPSMLPQPAGLALESHPSCQGPLCDKLPLNPPSYPSHFRTAYRQQQTVVPTSKPAHLPPLQPAAPTPQLSRALASQVPTAALGNRLEGSNAVSRANSWLIKHFRWEHHSHLLPRAAPASSTMTNVFSSRSPHVLDCVTAWATCMQQARCNRNILTLLF